MKQVIFIIFCFAMINTITIEPGRKAKKNMGVVIKNIIFDDERHGSSIITKEKSKIGNLK